MQITTFIPDDVCWCCKSYNNITLVHASNYPESIYVKNISTEAIAEVRVDNYQQSRCSTRSVESSWYPIWSDVMKEVSRLFPVFVNMHYTDLIVQLKWCNWSDWATMVWCDGFSLIELELVSDNCWSSHVSDCSNACHGHTLCLSLVCLTLIHLTLCTNGKCTDSSKSRFHFKQNVFRRGCACKLMIIYAGFTLLVYAISKSGIVSIA